MNFRNIILLLLASMMYIYGWADTETIVSSHIEAVQVYRQRAQIVREANVSVSKGDNLLIFSGLSRFILPNSITVSGKGKGTIQSVTHRVSYLNTTPKTTRMRMIEDSLQILRDDLLILKDERFVNESEQTLILENRKLGGTNTGFTAEDLTRLAELYQDRIARIRKKLREISRAEAKLTVRINAYQQELNGISSQRNQPTQQVVVAFQADQAGRVSLELAYMVNQASWSPYYDIRVANTTSPLQFFLKANVINNTGIDWDGVDVTLSTTNNNVNNTQPSLNPWYVGVYYPSAPVAGAYKARPKLSRRDGMGLSNTMNDDLSVTESAAEADIAYAYDATTISEGELGLEFEIALPYDIPADGKAHQVDIQLLEVEGNYKHFAVPKLDRDAFLVAQINQDLLRGKANVYFEGTFVGETYVNTDNPRDSLLISLGRDPKVQIQREQIKDYTKIKTIGSNIRKTIGYEISLRNNKSSQVTLVIEDQIPVSQDQDITVEALELSKGKLDPASGKVSWTLTLEPGEKRNIPLKFEVKYPKNKPVSGL
ncbi:MAG: DUF4139 domain-containing protein [Bacteroidota bacterium]